MNANPTPQLLLTAREAARALAISERTLWTLTKEGKFRLVKIGAQRRYILSQLREDIERLQSGSAGEDAVG